MFITGQCKKCKEKGIIDIGELELTKAIDLLQNMQFGECQFGGYHVEIGKMLDYIELDKSKIFETKEKAIEYNNNK
jgi:UTP-glucose-1-phosphate uridylyltransferase